jgi:LysM repeat protein
MSNVRGPLILATRVGRHGATLLVLLIGLAMASSGATSVFGAPREIETTTYVVAWGDTLSGIAGRYGTTVSAIMQANFVTNANLIYVGQRLAIPNGSPPPTTASDVYVVQSGDTLSGIAARHQTTVQQLVQMNGLSNPNLIAVGQRLAVAQGQVASGSENPSASGTAYQVRAGDTLIGIAARLQVGMWDIVLANNIANPSLIYVGQLLVIPGTGGSAAPASTTTPTSVPVGTGQPAASTPTPATPTAQPTAAATQPAVPTAGPAYAFQYVQGSLKQYPNCGTVYFKGRVAGLGGEPVNGRTVRLRFAGNVVYRVSGEGQDAGEWSFAPLAGDNYHSPFTFLIDVVESASNPASQSNMLEVRFTDCATAGQFDSIVFQYTKVSTAVVSSPTSTPQRTAAPSPAPGNIPAVEWDPRLNQFPCVRLVTASSRGAQLHAGDQYWRLVKARWLSEEESRRDIQIHVDLLDEAGQRVYGEKVVFENGGHYTVTSEPQSCCYPWDYPVKWPMFNTLCSYAAYVEGLPSDMVTGMGLGTPEHPDWTIHTGFVLTFQRTVYR